MSSAENETGDACRIDALIVNQLLRTAERSGMESRRRNRGARLVANPGYCSGARGIS